MRAMADFWPAIVVDIAAEVTENFHNMISGDGVRHEPPP
jgi:hypothetical protein